jgi:hypothetical protein
MCVIQNVPQDLTNVGVHSKLILETLQAEVLLSLYFMHSADLMQGRYHSAAATSIALGARLHLVGSQQQQFLGCCGWGPVFDFVRSHYRHTVGREFGREGFFFSVSMTPG